MQFANAESFIEVGSRISEACMLDMVVREKLGSGAVAYDTGLPRKFYLGGQNGRVNHENL